MLQNPVGFWASWRSRFAKCEQNQQVFGPFSKKGQRSRIGDFGLEPFGLSVSRGKRLPKSPEASLRVLVKLLPLRGAADKRFKEEIP
jgi:hypothetical protein